MRLLHELLWAQVCDTAEELGVPSASDVVQQHDLVMVRLPVGPQRGGVDGPQGADALCPWMELAEAVHGTLPVLGFPEGAPWVLHGHRGDAGVLHLGEGLRGGVAERA